MPDKKGRPQGSATFAWRSFFHQSGTPVFVLGKGRRLRYANPAWERIAGVKLADSLGLVCSARRHSSPLAAALAPTREALAGRTDRSRRAAPQHRSGPPWWDVAFVPLAADDGLLGIVGFIEVVGEAGPAASRRIPPAVMAIRDRHAQRFTFDCLSESFAAKARLASQIAAPVWLIGEPGSGKETVARAIHLNSAKREAMFVALDCKGLQPFLIESLLWGNGGLAPSDRVGTIYLKEPAALPRDLQQRLLDHFTDDAAKAPRLICGSVSPAGGEVRTGRLLPQFLTQLAVLELHVPPLRERLDELPRLLSKTMPKSIEPAALEVLKSHPWPGNFRELTAAVAEAAAAAGAGPILRDHLPRELRERLGIAKPAPEPSIALDPILEAVEKRLIKLALGKANGNAAKAAEMLGIWRTRLLRRVEALGLSELPRSPPRTPSRD
jgi:transcriptional regulator with PAS, ATPase and Fis domain